MRLRRLKITNFRCYKDEVIIDIDDLSVFIGKNDSGKSSLFDALDIFFNRVPDRDDVCVHGNDSIIKIACVFDDLPSEIVIDEQHPTDLKTEYLLNEEERLEIVKIFNCSGSGKVKAANVFANAYHPSADKYHDLLTLTNTKLKQRANELGVDLTEVNQTINTNLRQAIWSHADDLQFQLRDIELKSETAGKIWEQLKKSLPVYALFKSDRTSTDQDEEAQDPMKSAIKEAIKAQETKLNEIAEKVKHEVQMIADRTVEKIREMSPELANQLKPRVSNRNWESLFSVSLTGDEDIPINKRGSGTRRLVLLNFFRARAEEEAEGKGTGIIYAIEEPETSQHPNNQKLLIEAFEDLANRADCQVLITTHTPMLARRFGQSSLRYLTQENGRIVVHDGHSNSTLDEIIASLGVLPDHNIKVFVGVEGRNDITFLTTISEILHNAGEDVPDLKKAEDEGHLVFIPLGGSSLDLWVSKLEGFNRPEFYLMDRDTQPPEKPKYHAVASYFERQENCTVWITNKKEIENYIHPDVIRTEYPHYEGNGDPFEDVPLLFAKAVHEASDSPQSWAEIESNTEKLTKKESSAKRRLCTEFVSKMTPELLSSIDTDNEIRNWLNAIGDALRGH
jgi:predicted ATPase